MVEPHPILYSYLIDKFPNFKIYDFAVSDFNGESFFDVAAADYFFKKDDLDGLNLGLSKLSSKGGNVKVKTISGDEFLKIYVGDLIHNIDFIKIDTENRDYNILKSITPIIKDLKKKPFIVLEHNYHNDISKEEAKKIYEDFLSECDYDGLDFEDISSNAYLKPKN